MAEKKKGSTTEIVRALAEPLAKELGLIIWDVTFTKEGAGDLPENTEETETTLKTEITRGNMQLEICLNKINGSYEIAKWRCTARWQPDDSLNLG